MKKWPGTTDAYCGRSPLSRLALAFPVFALAASPNRDPCPMTCNGDFALMSRPFDSDAL
jgi:hypothetical protein